MYIDQEKKLAYYKKLIMDTITSSGAYPTPSMVQEELDDIDTALSIFRTTFKKGGDTFDVDDYNQKLGQIYQDLLILYQTVYELSVTEYNELKNEVDRQLQDLETYAQKAYQRSMMETTNLFGTTLYFASSGFKQEYENGTIMIPIDTIQTHEQARLACIVDGADSLPYDSMYFTINGTRIKPYNYNEDYYMVPGESNIQVYKYTLNTDKKAYTFPLSIDKFIPKNSNKYTVLAGKDKIVTLSYTSHAETIVAKESNMALSFPNACTLSFWVYNATDIQFEFDRNPIRTSFNGTRIASPDKKQKIEIELAANTVMDIKTDGDIYAYLDTPFLSDDTLYTYRRKDIYDYLLEETSEPDTVTISDIKLVIENADHSYYGITDIAIKESQTVIV